MFKFDMSISQNYAIFYSDTNCDDIILVESFDNIEFSVRRGCLTEETKYLGKFNAYSNEELNDNLQKLISIHRN